jgi:hypothetical protein
MAFGARGIAGKFGQIGTVQRWGECGKGAKKFSWRIVEEPFRIFSCFGYDDPDIQQDIPENHGLLFLEREHALPGLRGVGCGVRPFDQFPFQFLF